MMHGQKNIKCLQLALYKSDCWAYTTNILWTVKQNEGSLLVPSERKTQIECRVFQGR